MKTVVLMLCVTFIFTSCQSQKKQEGAIDTIIAKYDSTDFSCLKNTFISRRGGDRTTATFMVSNYTSSCSPYVVTVDRNTKKVTKVENNLVKKNCEDYFTAEQISQFMSCFLQYEFVVLGVDEHGAVYINPDKQDVPTILRKSADDTPKDISRFSHYQGEWYLRK